MDPDLDRLFDYHAPDETTIVTHRDVRRINKAYAAEILSLIPDGREKALFLTSLETASFWAHAALARNQEN